MAVQETQEHVNKFHDDWCRLDLKRITQELIILSAAVSPDWHKIGVKGDDLSSLSRIATRGGRK